VITTLLKKGHRQWNVHIAMLTALQQNVRASLIEDIRLAE